MTLPPEGSALLGSVAASSASFMGSIGPKFILVSHASVVRRPDAVVSVSSSPGRITNGQAHPIFFLDTPYERCEEARCRRIGLKSSSQWTIMPLDGVRLLLALIPAAMVSRKRSIYKIP